MDFELSDRAKRLQETLLQFMDEKVYPAEAVYEEQMRASGDPEFHPPIIEELKVEARRRGLWNLFLPHETKWTEGLQNAEYAPLAEISGRSPHLAPEAMNCSAPDTGNMEILAMFGTPEQQEQWLAPLLEGEIRSCFAMTEPDVASSDATNIATRIERDGDELVINGRKWWSSGAGRERCTIAIVMGKSDPGARTYAQQSFVLVPLDTPGITRVRNLKVFGYQDRETHAELLFEDVRVPASNMIGPEGGGFMMSQARLGPGRIHHCMRAIGMAERALELLCRRAQERVAFGKPIAEQGVVQDWIAESRMEIDQARLLTMYAAWLMDSAGNKAARNAISAIKVVAPNAALKVVDRAIQVHGGAGVCEDFPLAEMYAGLRTLRLADGPDEVHKMVIARRELRRHAGAGS
ncbi:MAG TPA: acyl-CoA dehydrogenase family protein [Solirubrobacteraceae bacterium]|nr:acyl-CoA dehydrogenase family protein [Solirubrobacteraceae bacterium]